MNPITEIANKGWGTAHEFRQAALIRVTGWGSVNVKDRRGALVFGNGLRDGVCAGLTALYVVQKGDWGNFKLKLASPTGLAMVRGLMNLSAEADRTDALGISDESYFRNYRKMFGRFVKASGGSSLQSYREQSNNNVAVEGLNYVTRRDGLYVLAFFFGGSMGHAVAFANHGGNLRYFDPNHGELSVNRQDNLGPLFTWLINGQYGAVTSWYIMRFSA